MSSSQIDDASSIMINFRLSIKKFKQGDWYWGVWANGLLLVLCVARLCYCPFFFLMFWGGRIEAYAWQQIRQSLFRTPGSHFSMSCFCPILQAIICSSGLTLAGWHKCLTAYHCELIYLLHVWVISIPSCIYTLVTMSGHSTLFSSIVLPLDVIC